MVEDIMWSDGFMVAFTGDRDRPARAGVRLSEGSGRDVRLEIGGRVVAVTHGSDWYRVERLCDDMADEWLDTHTTSSART